MKEVVYQDTFGICPICGKVMYALTSKCCLYAMTYTGQYPNKLLKMTNRVIYQCACGYSKDMVPSVYGMVPKSYWKLKEQEKELQKPIDSIGYVE